MVWGEVLSHKSEEDFSYLSFEGCIERRGIIDDFSFLVRLWIWLRRLVGSHRSFFINEFMYVPTFF